MNDPEIESGFIAPIPKPVKKWPFKKMKVGESVFYNGENSLGAAACYARTYGAKTGKKFTARASPEGVRIWRVE